MTILHPAVFWAVVVGFTGVSANAQSIPAAYDPVNRAATLGLTPEYFDRAFDISLSVAEACDRGSAAMMTLACEPTDTAGNEAIINPGFAATPLHRKM